MKRTILRHASDALFVIGCLALGAAILWALADAAHGDQLAAARSPTYGEPRWLEGTSDGQAGWFLARGDDTGRFWVFAADQPSGRKEPCYLHRRGMNAASPLGASASPLAIPASAPVRNYGVNVGALQAAQRGPQVMTNDPGFGERAAADLGASEATHEHDGSPCRPDNPDCPLRPRKPDPPDDPGDDVGPDQLRPYLLPGAIVAGVGVIGWTLYRRRTA